MEYEIVKYILDMHIKYSISFIVSVAQLSSNILRKKFLEEPIPAEMGDSVKCLS